MAHFVESPGGNRWSAVAAAEPFSLPRERRALLGPFLEHVGSLVNGPFQSRLCFFKSSQLRQRPAIIVEHRAFVGSLGAAFLSQGSASACLPARHKAQFSPVMNSSRSGRTFRAA